jgi:hypothetical protein
VTSLFACLLEMAVLCQDAGRLDHARTECGPTCGPGSHSSEIQPVPPEPAQKLHPVIYNSKKQSNFINVKADKHK